MCACASFDHADVPGCGCADHRADMVGPKLVRLLFSAYRWRWQWHMPNFLHFNVRPAMASGGPLRAGLSYLA